MKKALWVLALLGLAGCQGAPAPGNEETPAGAAMFRAGPTRAGLYETPSVESLPVVKWTYRTEGPIRSSPAVTARTVYFGSGDGHLYAVDRDSGHERWRFAAGGPVHGSPAVAGGLVFVTSMDRRLYAVEEGTGGERWRVAFGEDLPFKWGWDYFTSSPVVAGGAIFVGGGDGYLYSLDAAMGSERWRFRTGGRVRSSPAVAGGVVYSGSMDGRLYAVDAETGAEIWRFDSLGAGLDSEEFGFDRTSIQSSPAIAGGTVAVGARDGHLYLVDAETGEERWRFDHEVSWVVSSPASAGGFVYAGSSDGRFFHAVHLASGEEEWRFATAGNVFSSGAVAGEAVYFGCWDGFLYALDRGSGEELWRFRTGGQVHSSPAIAGGMVYFGSDDGSLYALEGSTVRRAVGEQLERAVFWREHEGFRWFNGGERVRDYLREEGYAVLDGPSLAAFMEERIADRRRSVVVFAIDRVPEEIGATPSANTLFNRYLRAGGKIVWVGLPPYALEIEPESGRVTALNLERSGEALGVPHARVGYDDLGTRPTDVGRRWGLKDWWVGTGGIDPRGVSAVLATDEEGRAVSWVKSFGGGEGTGFVRIWGGREIPFDLAGLKAVAEYPGGEP